MRIPYAAEFRAGTAEEAASAALERYRAFVGDPQADLPWDALVSVKDGEATLLATIHRAPQDGV